MTAEQIYTVLRAAMNDAERHENHLYVTKPAAEHGLKHGPNGRNAGIGIEDEWRLVDDGGSTVLLTWSMQDTTRTFEPTGPDVNRLHLSLLDANGKTLASHGVTYYD